MNQCMNGDVRNVFKKDLQVCELSEVTTLTFYIPQLTTAIDTYLKKRSIKIRENLHTTNLLSFWNLHKRDDGPETLTWGRVRFDLMGRDWTIFGGGLLDKAIWQRFVALEKNTVFSYIFLNIVPMIFYLYILRIYHDFINHSLTC